MTTTNPPKTSNDPRQFANLALLCALSGEAVKAAVEHLRAGGYRPTAEQLQAIAKALSDPEFLSAALLAGTDRAIPPAALEESAREQGRRAVRDVLGAPLH